MTRFVRALVTLVALTSCTLPALAQMNGLQAVGVSPEAPKDAIGIIAYAAFHGTRISTLGGAVWDSQLVYSLTITPAVTASAVLLACGLGLLGGIVPAARAARSNVADALHAN